MGTKTRDFLLLAVPAPPAGMCRRARALHGLRSLSLHLTAVGKHPALGRALFIS